jgi:hypothetical protein
MLLIGKIAARQRHSFPIRPGGYADLGLHVLIDALADILGIGGKEILGLGHGIFILLLDAGFHRQLPVVWSGRKKSSGISNYCRSTDQYPPRIDPDGDDRHMAPIGPLRFAGVERNYPIVQWAGHVAAVDDTLGQRPVEMRTKVMQRMDIAVASPKDRDLHLVGKFERPSTPQRDFFDGTTSSH